MIQVSKRLLLAMTFTAALLVHPVHAQTTTTKSITFTLDPSYYCAPGCCGFEVNPDPGGTAYITLWQFTDPVPTYAIRVRSALLSWFMGNGKDFSWQGVPTVTLYLNSVQLGPTTTVTNDTACKDFNGVTYTFDSGDYPTGYSTYVRNGQNTIAMLLYNGSIYPSAPATLRVTYEVVAPYEFNITDNNAPEARRVLLSNLRSDYSYPFFQAAGGADSAVNMWVRARTDAGTYLPNTTVYLRVGDPADTAAYMNLPPTPIAQAGDNYGPVATLDGSVSPDPNHPGVYVGTTDSSGQIDFVLHLPSGTAAGNNYQIQASYDPTFPASAITKSGSVTAWKRIFVEKHRMLRNGMLLTADAPAGSSTIRVHGNSYGGNQGNARLRSGDDIVLVHAPQLDRSDLANGWYYEFHAIYSVQQVSGTSDYIIGIGNKTGSGRQTTVVPATLSRGFRIEGLDTAVSDGIARVTTGGTLSSSDYFDAPDTLLAQYDGNGVPISAFPQAFVDYNVLPDASLPGGFVPVSHVAASMDNILQDFANRWSTSVGSGGIPSANYQLLIIADTDGSTSSDAGQTTYAVSGQTSSFTFRGAIDAAVRQSGPHHGQNPDNWATKNEVHELTHQWHVDDAWLGTPGVSPHHCPPDSTVFDNSSVYCVEATSSPTQSETQSDNMIARYHLRQLGGVWDSEYFTIRQRMDPFVP